MKRASALALVIVLTITPTACGYFNTLYNARREFTEAQRAAMRGEQSAAQTRYNGAIEKAAKSYRKYPNGRWSDDALYLIARARFELRQYDAAHAASTELLAKTTDPAMRGDAHAILGASAFQLGDPTNAMVHLDSAVQQTGKELRGRAHLWRARVHLAAQNVAAAWADLNAVEPDDPSYAAVQLERIAIGIQVGDTAQTAAAFNAMLLRDDARQWVDTLSDLAMRAASAFGATSTRHMLGTPLPEWTAAARDSVALLRARLALRGGDTATAWGELNELAARSSTAIANAARVSLALSHLQRADELSDLRAVRPMLLPAISDQTVQTLIRSMGIVEALVGKAQNAGQLVALFAAAEIARDDLGAHKLARRLFITFADVAPQTPWAPKALLAALALAPDADDSPVLRDRLLQHSASPYVQATQDGADAEAFTSAEERLQRSLIALREEGAALAQQQDLSVTRVVATLDSLRIVARTDSTRVSCGLLIDTLAVKGIRADSVRRACMRSDTLKVAEYLKIDTLLWRGRLGEEIVRKQPGKQPPKPIKPDTIR
jgi:tetratricopeptide (TPR) repeat protein